MATDVQIASLALTRIGHDVVTSFSASGNKAQRWMFNNFEFIKTSLLREHQWRFAIKRATLTLDATYTDTLEYAYRFEIPADCLRVIRINASEADEYRVEQGYIYTDEGTVHIEYIFDQTDESKFDAQFVDLLASRLSAEIAFFLTDNSTLTEQAWDIYNRKLSMARTMDSRQGTPRGIEADAWLNARA